MAWLSRLRSILGGNEIERDLDDELRLHVELKTRENMESGMPPEEARYEALRAFGGVERKKEECRDADRLRLLEDVVQDLRYGVRMLAKSPGFTLVVIMSLALGIGANTAIFSLIDAVLLKMLPVAHPEQLVTIGCTSDDSFSFPTYKRLRDDSRAFSGVLAFRTFGDFDLEVDGQAGLAKGQVVSGNYYSVLGVNAFLGRTITPEDDKAAGAGPVAVISYEYWVKRFARNTSVVGKKIILNGSPFTVIGVTPPDFFGLEPGESVDVSVPLSMVTQVKQDWSAAGSPYSILSAPFRNWLHLMGRLKPGVSEAQALANAAPIFKESMREAVAGLAGLPFDSPRSRQMFLQTQLRLEPGGRGLAALRQRFSKPLFILMAIVGLLLLIACANVANLLLARGSARAREIAMRTALGAGRSRIVRQLLTESLLLASAGGVCGLLLAMWGSSGLLTLMARSSSPVSLSVQPDARVLGFTALVSLVTVLLFGLAPAVRAVQLDLAPALKQSAQAPGGSRSRAGFRKALVISQVALSLVLLIGAGLLVRSLENLKNFYPGFNAQQVLLFSVNPGLVGYKEEQAIGLYQKLLADVRAIPGMRAASFADFSPLGASYSYTLPTVEGYRHRTDEYVPVMINVVGPDYFKTLEIPVVLGREFTQADAAGTPKVAVINQAMAHYYFGETNPLGRRFSLPGWRGDASWLEIIGVIQDAKSHSLREQSPPQAYIAFLQYPETGSVTVEVRATTELGSIAAAVRRGIREIDGRVPVYDVKALSDQLDESLIEERLVASLSALFGLLALLLASIGLYGLTAYSVARRTSEIGIRMALGARRGDVWRMVMRETAVLVTVGVALGLPLALAGARFISSILFDLKPTDPATIAAGTVILLAVATAASYIPARHASQVDPMIALRYE